MTTAVPAEAFKHGDPRRYRRGCRCQPCTKAVSRQTRKDKFLRQTGRGSLRALQAAASHLRALRGAGMTDAQIKQAANLPPDVMYRILRGDGHIRIATERRILAVPLPAVPMLPVSAAYTNGAGTHRRLQALAAVGWPGSELAARLGIFKQQATYLLHARGTGNVEIHTAAKVRVLYGELWGRRPEDCGVLPHIADRARLLAARNSWHPAAVWDDIDNPAEQPQYGAETLRREAIVEDTAELAAQGFSREAIAGRLGIAWNSIQQAHIRCGVPVPAVAS